MNTYRIRIEAGAVVEGFEITARSPRAAVWEAFERFEPMVSPRSMEHAEVTLVEVIA